MKFYAVKNGRKIGIYTDWEQCREQVSGYSGAEYKAFASKSDAEAFISGAYRELSGGENKSKAKKEAFLKPAAYVDGSYNSATGVFGFGAVLFWGEEMLTFSEGFSDEELALMHNVAGELKGAEFVMRYCAEHNIPEIDLYYDYEGIAAWAQGRWKTNRSGTRSYKAFYDSIKERVNVNFIKVKGHSGDEYNDMADALAKKAAGIN